MVILNLDPLLSLAAVALIAVVAVGVYLLSIPISQSQRDPPPHSYVHHFIDPQTGAKHQFPSIYSSPEKYISLIVPAYNEEDRMDAMMKETLEYCEKRHAEDSSFTYEIVVVSDGSRDKTAEKTLNYSRKYSTDIVRLLDLKVNQGKGGAVQQGILHARGKYVLFVDADGATDIRDLGKLEKQLLKVEKDGHGLAVGSRAHLEDTAVAQRKWYRNVLMYGFHFLVSSLCVRGVRDTQCGFKLFTRKTAQMLFGSQHLRRWSFDVELLHIAQRLGNVPMAEVAVRWQEIPGSKLNLLTSSILMGRDLVVIRFAYMFGVWSIDHDPAATAKAAHSKSK